MAVVYILVRTFPFWAIPLGIALMIDYVRPPKGRTRRKQAWISLVASLALLVGSAAFLFLQGHKKAVPMLHEWLKSPLALPPEQPR